MLSSTFVRSEAAHMRYQSDRTREGLLPWALGPVRRDEDVGTAEGVVSPVGDVVKDFLHHRCVLGIYSQKIGKKKRGNKKFKNEL